jgi:hypothetical protein
VDDPKNCHDIAVRVIEYKVGADDAEPNAATKPRTGSAERRMVADKGEQAHERAPIFSSDAGAGFVSEAVEYLVNVAKSGGRDDRPGH